MTEHIVLLSVGCFVAGYLIGGGFVLWRLLRRR